MTPPGTPTNGAYFTLYIAGQHYGFADFDYPTPAGVYTQTCLTLGKDYYVEMPMRAVYCLMATVILPLLLIAVSIICFRCLRRSQPSPSSRRLSAS